MSRGRGQKLGDDAGLTLVELSVAMLLTGLLITSCLALYTSALRTASGTQSRLEEISDGRIAMAAVSRSLRTAILPNQLFDTASTDTAAFIEATPWSVRFFANIDNPGNTVGPSKVTYTIQGDRLIETIQPPNPRAAGETVFTYCDPADASCPVRTRTLAWNVQQPAGQPLFTYFDQLGNAFSATTPLTQADMERVDAVDLRLTLFTGRSGGDGTTYVTRVSLPNRDAVSTDDED
jgi:hypothetical protein